MEILILEDVIVNVGDDRGGVPVSAGALIDVPAPVARNLVIALGRGLYANKSDDPTKGRKTAPADVIKLAREKAGKAAAANGKAAAGGDA